MAESVIITADRADKAAVYRELNQQLSLLLEGESDEIACFANTAAALKEVFSFFWVGFYRVKGDSLVIGPFQGPAACNRIGYGKGVCGKSWQEKRTILVPDVDAFPGHIACSSLSKSEIVVPLKDKSGNIRAVLDVDSISLNHFDTKDQQGLKEICDTLEKLIYW